MTTNADPRGRTNVAQRGVAFSLAFGLTLHAASLAFASGQITGLRNLTHSTQWRVTCDGEPVTVYTTTKPSACQHETNGITSMSFCSIDLPAGKGAAALSLAARGAGALEVRPRHSSRSQRVGAGRLRLRVAEPEHLVVLRDGAWEDALVISIRRADDLGRDGAAHYFGPGVHRIGERYRIRSDETAYLERGAIVIGSFEVADASNARICGRGVVYGGDDPHREDYRVVRGSHAQGLIVDGVTFANSPGWIVSVWDESRNLTVRDVAMVGNYRYNTDGVQTGVDGLVVENCFLQTNDDNFSLNGSCRNARISDNVLWNLYNGGVFMLGWGDGDGFQLRDIAVRDNVIVRAGGCCDHHRKGPFSLMLKGDGGSAKRISFERIRVEELLPDSNWLDIRAGDASTADLSDWSFDEVSIDSTWKVRGLIEGPTTGSPVRGVRFKDVSIAGRTVQTEADAGLTMIRAKPISIEPTAAARDATPPRPQSLLGAPDLEGTAAEWRPYNEGECRVSIEAAAQPPGGRALRVYGRRSPHTGLYQNVTERLRAAGSGEYVLGAMARASGSPVGLRVVLKVTDRDGVRYVTTDEIRARDEGWATVRQRRQVDWRGLIDAEWSIQSAGDATDAFLIGAGFLHRSDAASANVPSVRAPHSP